MADCSLLYRIGEIDLMYELAPDDLSSDVLFSIVDHLAQSQPRHRSEQYTSS